ncbi:MAG: L,D-transpeptidase [Pseudorhodoplanes sp.]|nr:L,D-transpeptidase [Pseudorhodoplanes sp.]
MRHAFSLFLAAAILAGIATVAQADVEVRIDKSAQRMAVIVDGVQRYSWAVSTGTGGGPPSGQYRPQRLERSWYSRKYGRAPMPHSIFFDEGYAIHGTIHVSRLGQRASHGCVRLHPANAATLFNLVRQHGMGNTRILVVSGLAQSPGSNRGL